MYGVACITSFDSRIGLVKCQADACVIPGAVCGCFERDVFLMLRKNLFCLRARVYPCRKCCICDAALAAEGIFWVQPRFFRLINPTHRHYCKSPVYHAMIFGPKRAAKSPPAERKLPSGSELAPLARRRAIRTMP